MGECGRGGGSDEDANGDGVRCIFIEEQDTTWSDDEGVMVLRELEELRGSLLTA